MRVKSKDRIENIQLLYKKISLPKDLATLVHGSIVRSGFGSGSVLTYVTYGARAGLGHQVFENVIIPNKRKQISALLCLFIYDPLYISMRIKPMEKLYNLSHSHRK